MKTHTPAPWIFCTYSNKDFGVYAEDAPSGKDIALVRNYYDDETNRANAQLIAAAPELLSALQFLYDTREDNSLYDYALSKASEAIYKATGETLC